MDTNVEYTLQDTYEDLTDLKQCLCKEIDDLTIEIKHNKISALKTSCTSDEVITKQRTLANSIWKYIPNKPPKNYPIPNTIDIHIDTLDDLEKEIVNAKSLLNKTIEELHNIEKDINYLENKRNDFNKMREKYLTTVQLLENNTYEQELRMSKKLFKEAKQDLRELVDLLFPQNKNFSNILSELVMAYAKGGDDIYVDMRPEILDCVKYLVEADIVMYHPNDKNKIKMNDLL
ncbi:PREDICTED: uncharacterized protein LOC107070810 [Polistes dominula]|uniref:Uncharacterized protein LOC107070810 n=1 Tax=Polistes dominula TaxID=743375 RepID=A0ABM1IX78_POLDO|nr:PREDICTED: uncharacterized protein LOC107070810 [Polistes dominula]